MRLSQAIFLGLIQGLTEFLPVSSSGHLVIAQKLLGFTEPPILFDILVHLGTLLAILFYFKKKIVNFYKSFSNLKLVFVGTIPAAIGGVVLSKSLETIFNSFLLVGFALLITAGLLFATIFFKKPKKGLSYITLLDAFLIGCFQALALFPGISRSGSTIVGGLGLKLRRKSAFLFSFFLAIPAILGALILEIPKLSLKGNLTMGLVGMLTAALTGLLALKILEKAVLKGKLQYFALYCLSLGLLVLSFSFTSLLPNY